MEVNNILNKNFAKFYKLNACVQTNIYFYWLNSLNGFRLLFFKNNLIFCLFKKIQFSFQNKYFTARARDIEIQVDASQIYQDIQGFGGAFSDAAGINIKKLPSKLQNKLLR